MGERLPERATLRTADADREAVVEVLRHNAAAGRLDVEELTERIGRALSAKTFGDLDELTADLPVEGPAVPLLPRWRRPLVLIAAEVAVFDLFFVSIWLLTGHSGSFWPGWIILISAFWYLRRFLKEHLRRARHRERAERRAG